ncbi:hypothetical protein FHL15_006152 [Xylaria flabelliformis]|uniref:F-box domain-containing protein n=1 Tax=Xylaria flabelliformis TaxID=2512241 RepID=A0A553HYH5_9PEZI|nr:hypothetical protein FHL15_006152 [Xylaria flabelliformis]
MDLPTEIWQMIYEDIQDNKTLSRLSRTCRFLWELGIPLLYKKFETFDFNDGRPTQYQSLSAFIRTVSNNQYLARVVTEVSCTTSAYTKHYDREDLFRQYSQYDSALVGDVARRLRVPVSNIRMSSAALWGVSSRSSFAHQLLVCSLPNLKTLELKVPSSSEGFNECLSIWAKNPSNRLWSLTELKIEEESIARRFNFADVQDIIRYSPNLEYLSLKRCYSITADYDLDLRNLKRLRIIESRFHREGLFLCKYCRHLENFTYISFGPHWAMDRLPAEIVVALEPAKQTLRQLEIFHFSRDSPREQHQGIESLRDFPVLETVTLNPGALSNITTSSPDTPSRGMFVEKLPDSLVALTLVNVSRDLFEDIRLFAQRAIEGGFPHLQTVSISGGPPDPTPDEDRATSDHFDESEWGLLRAMFESGGIEFDCQSDWWHRLRSLCDMAP